MNPNKLGRAHWLAAVPAFVAAVLAGCSTTPLPPAKPVARIEPTAPVAPAEPVASLPIGKISQANSARDYRRDAASHLYELNPQRIYKGKMPALLHAVGVLQINLDGQGDVSSLHWMRAPSHAPEVIAEIERTVRQAAPYPAPVRLGHVTYTETWLWHKSGRFQLDTLTEGQL